MGGAAPRQILLTVCKRPSSTKPIRQSTPQQRKNIGVVLAAAAASGVGYSIYTRHVRREKLSTLTPARESALLAPSSANNNDTSLPTRTSPKYDVDSLIETITRASLVGSTKSVKDELDALRKWHIDRGYNGGLVVRDLSRPLFSLDMFQYEKSDSNSNNSDSNTQRNIGNMNQRECYYMYYEIHSNGETQQQIFCRGTTLFSDILTCLQSWFDYDQELGCRVHHGFNEHANRIVEDVIPLLVPPNNKSTVEVCGHSLGGAVAMLVAIKLRKRGYHVSKVTSVGGPRFCRGLEERDMLEQYLPDRTIRIEDDMDLVTYLPPQGVGVGDKIWLVSDYIDGTKKSEAFVLSREWMESEMSEFTESVWLNLRLLESLRTQHITHRVHTYVTKLKQIYQEPQ